jgi:hypothetical protein
MSAKGKNMNRNQGIAVAEPAHPDQERFIQAILDGAAELWQNRCEPVDPSASSSDREAAARLRELRSRSTAYGLAFGHRE